MQQARAFNNIAIDYKNNIITKSSSNIAKLKDEINYYLSLPKTLAQFFPNMIEYSKDYSFYKIEYFPYQNLSEIIFSKNITFKMAQDIILRLMNILDKIHHVNDKKDITFIDVQNFYIDKTINRVDELRENKFLQPIVDAREIYINEKRYQNFNVLKDKFIQAIRQLICEESNIGAIHGDFCFSNILYNVNTQHIKLIDPRGSFNYTGIYGHTAYDFAKILHCLNGRYDCLVAERFQLKEIKPHCFIFEKNEFPILNKLNDFYVKLLDQRKINFKILLLIEASLFLSMSSLHYENLHRQKALYLTGIMLLNDFFEK